MTVPAPPSGAVALPARHVEHELGRVAVWRHAVGAIPWLEVRLNRATVGDPLCKIRPPRDRPTVDVRTGPASFGVDGVTDPEELRQQAWLLLGAARWLERELGGRNHREPVIPQPSLLDALAELDRPRRRRRRTP